ncbi:hypothetical protein SAMD00019534_037710 [Acytostelium subglobosum LB1]|uniref:hypothetical protein n=1 Tax=Acytostelium subglobosum LB1 TaxID=1410327 RepID=UPI000645232F|nr:hypothetical protein SAMD00019534_037710 [Acytostelium subglobosum LB1]GAM20596.1 hypothetical protein SAMD00019534_037710 [Acytostelium subglobosum LB1]|eukprot:XP_012760117.1 hypothetical protein SAMD00019534_037710 [Acytostelium subglobosum LB1]
MSMAFKQLANKLDVAVVYGLEQYNVNVWYERKTWPLEMAVLVSVHVEQFEKSLGATKSSQQLW